MRLSSSGECIAREVATALAAPHRLPHQRPVTSLLDHLRYIAHSSVAGTLSGGPLSDWVPVAAAVPGSPRTRPQWPQLCG